MKDTKVDEGGAEREPPRHEFFNDALPLTHIDNRIVNVCKIRRSVENDAGRFFIYGTRHAQSPNIITFVLLKKVNGKKLLFASTLLYRFIPSR